MTTVETRPWARDPNNPGAEPISRVAWDFPPYHRWTFQHVREMVPTAQVWRGPGPVLPLPERRIPIDGIVFSVDGRSSTVGAFLEESFTDGFLVLSQGHVIDERYGNGLTAHGQHLAMSVSKSITSAVCGILVHRGLIDPAAPVTAYLPELEATAYRGALVRHLLDMTSGVFFDEAYTVEGSHMQQLGQASGWLDMRRDDWPQTVWQLILGLTVPERPHGALFRYRSIETDVLAFVMQRATGRALAELIATELWQPMGAEEDAYITVDPGGYALADGGFNATLRDFGRFALLLANGGRAHGRQVVPAEWIAATRSADHGLFQGEYREALPRGAYRNQFWIEDPERRAFMCRGIFGQYIYVDPEAGFAAVKLSTWPEPVDDARSRQTIAAVGAIRDHLARTGGA